jgi:hypothetical protein
MKTWHSQKFFFVFMLSFAFCFANATRVTIIYTKHSIDSIAFFKKRKIMMLEWSGTFQLPVGDTVYSFQMISKMEDTLTQYSYPVHFLNDSISVRITYLKINDIAADSIAISYTCYLYNKDQQVERKEIASMKHIQIAKSTLTGFYTRRIPGAIGYFSLMLLMLLVTYGEAALIVSWF